ncbi:MAG: hypothetical protein GF334_10325 [Candidatus Altiarchaeales archaeon]|nr:hypothetical protein [Candidatus Altiarchaeales archaeon]
MPLVTCSGCGNTDEQDFAYVESWEGLCITYNIDPLGDGTFGLEEIGVQADEGEFSYISCACCGTRQNPPEDWEDNEDYRIDHRFLD